MKKQNTKTHHNKKEAKTT